MLCHEFRVFHCMYNFSCFDIPHPAACLLEVKATPFYAKCGVRRSVLAVTIWGTTSTSTDPSPDPSLEENMLIDSILFK
jgi:hypothetical protein